MLRWLVFLVCGRDDREKNLDRRVGPLWATHLPKLFPCLELRKSLSEFQKDTFWNSLRRVDIKPDGGMGRSQLFIEGPQGNSVFRTHGSNQAIQRGQGLSLFRRRK